MIENILRHAGGIEAYGIFSIALFFICFLGVLFWALRLRKPLLDSMAALPLDHDDNQAKSE